MNNKNFMIVVIILFFVSAVGIIAYMPARIDAALKIKVANFPKEIGEWTATDLPIDETTYKILETRNLFIRDYKNSKGESVYLYIVYSEDNRKVSHPPEVCFMGSGMTITSKTSIPVTDATKAVKLLVEKVDSRDLVIYWFKAGSLNTDKYLTQQAKIMVDRIFGKRTSGALIRVSTNIAEDKEKEGMELIEGFVRQIEPLLVKYIP